MFWGTASNHDHSPFPPGLSGQAHTSKVKPLNGALGREREESKGEIERDR